MPLLVLLATMETLDELLVARLRGVRTPTKLSDLQLRRYLGSHADGHVGQQALLDTFQRLRDQAIVTPPTGLPGNVTLMTPSMPDGYATPKALSPQPISDSHSASDVVTGAPPGVPPVVPEVSAVMTAPQSPVIVDEDPTLACAPCEVLQAPRGKPESKLRQVFRSSGAWRSVQGPNDVYLTHCVLKPCSCPIVWERKPATNRRMAHLLQGRSVSAAEWKDASSTEDIFTAFLAKEFPKQKMQGKLKLGGGVNCTSALCSACKIKLKAPDAQRKILGRIKKRSAQQKRLTESYAKKVCVCDNQPQTMRRGMKSFLKTYSDETRAEYYWDGPARSSVQDVHKREEDFSMQHQNTDSTDNK